MNRRHFFGSLSAAATTGLGASATAQAKAREALSSMQITRIRFFEAPSRVMFNQSAHVSIVETNQGITGVGEGGY